MQELDQQIRSEGEKLARLQRDGEAIKERIAQLEGLLRGNKEDQLLQQDKLTGLRVQKASLAQQIKARQDYLEQLEYQYLELEKTRQEEEGELIRLGREEEELQAKLAADEAALDQLRQQGILVGEGLRQLQEKREGLQLAEGELEEKIGVQRQDLTAATERLHQLERDLTRLETSLEELERRMFEDFGLTAAQAREYREDALPEGQWRQRVGELKVKLDQLRNVNLQAGKQYREVKERYDFLSQQLQDLVEARRSLDKLVREIDAISRERLEETFAAVQDSFQQVFQELFGGGKAQIQFTEGKISWSGPEIMVQPPGRNYRTSSFCREEKRPWQPLPFSLGFSRSNPVPFVSSMRSTLPWTKAMPSGWVSSCAAMPRIPSFC